MRAAARGPTARLCTPPLAALARLEAALLAARAALIAEHPDAGCRGRHAAKPARPLVLIAARVIERMTELRPWLTRYRRALDTVHPDPDHDRRQAELPF
jgi:hypothetical protein